MYILFFTYLHFNENDASIRKLIKSYDSGLSAPEIFNKLNKTVLDLALAPLIYQS